MVKFIKEFKPATQNRGKRARSPTKHKQVHTES